MALADEIPDEAVKAFREASVAASKLSNAKVREALAAAVQKMALGKMLERAVANDVGVLGLELDDPEIPDGWTPEGMLVIVRGEHEEQRSIFWRAGGDVTLWEMVGMLQCASDGVRRQIAAS